MTVPQFIHSRVDGHLSSFRILSVGNSVTVNILLHGLIHITHLYRGYSQE